MRIFVIVCLLATGPVTAWDTDAERRSKGNRLSHALFGLHDVQLLEARRSSFL
ncbi:unnamed protein product [Ectocarpus sp. CCAP 1310/34]|nr:unnamed protein product [Ectocarpus sp. CCAP 1310/34]